MPALNDPRVSHTIGLAAALAAVIASWQVLYLPAIRRLASVRDRLVGLRQQVGQAEAMLTQAGGEAGWLARQREVLSELERRVPPSREVPMLLDRLLDQVAAHQLHVVDVSQGNLEPAADAQGSPIQAGDTPCLALPVTLTVEGAFRHAVAFLDEVTGAGLPALVGVTRVQMKTHDALSATLRISLDLVLYVAGA